jgi:hypothetical protein
MPIEAGASVLCFASPQCQTAVEEDVSQVAAYQIRILRRS